jgi:two-component sensor histidine kinase
VRDLGQRLGKKIELRLSGDTTELDKTVLEKIGDPLVHLVRNAIDHGIETPEVRLAAGKPAHGVIELSAYHKGGNVIVEVRDDGGGLRRDRILAKARERGLVGATRISPRIAFSISSSRPASLPPTWSATCPAAAWAWTWSSATSTSSAATYRFIRPPARAAWCVSACR